MKIRKEVIILKKISLIITVLLLLSFYSPAFAANDKVKTNNSKANRVAAEEMENEDEDSDSEDDGEDEGYKSPSELAKERNALRKLEKIQATTNDPEVEEEVEEVAEEQEEVQESIEESLEAVDDRPAAVKFLIGPDFKNLGQLRKEVVHTRNNIRKLEKVSEKVTGETKEAVDEAITELEATSLNLQASIGEKLEGFSLFGWLARWLSGFDAPEELSETPVESAEPTVSPEATTVPTEAPVGSPSASPVESPTVTVEPVPSPEVTQ